MDWFFLDFFLKRRVAGALALCKVLDRGERSMHAHESSLYWSSDFFFKARRRRYHWASRSSAWRETHEGPGSNGPIQIKFNN